MGSNSALEIVPNIETPALGKQRCVDELKLLLARAEAGDIIGILFCVQETVDRAWYHGKVNLSMSEAVGMSARMTHRYNQLWDQET